MNREKAKNRVRLQKDARHDCCHSNSRELSALNDDDESDYEDPHGPKASPESSDFEDDEPLTASRRQVPKGRRRESHKSRTPTHKKQVVSKNSGDGESTQPRANGKQKLKRSRDAKSEDPVQTKRMKPSPKSTKGKGKLKRTRDDASEEIPPRALKKHTPNDVPNEPKEDDVPNEPKKDRDAGVDADEGDDAESNFGEIEIPLHLLDIREDFVGRLEFAACLPPYFHSWDDFHTEFDEFMKARYALFKRRTSTNVKTRNAAITDPNEKIPESFVKYAQTTVCTHGLVRQETKKDNEFPRQCRRGEGRVLHLKNDAMRLRTIQATSPFSKDFTSVVSVVNLGGPHWQAFYIDLAASTCTLYDPLLGDDASLRSLKREVQKFMNTHAPKKTLKYNTFTEVFGELEQNDGDSCGVYCCVALEIMMGGMKLNPEDVLPSHMYRARYMAMMATTQRKLTE